MAITRLGLYGGPRAALSEDDVLNAVDVESASEVSNPVVGQVHVLTAVSVQSTSEVTTPVVTEGNHILFAEDTESASEVSSPVIAQVHVLLADDIESQSETGTPTLDRSAEVSEDAPSGGWAALNAYDSYRQKKRKRKNLLDVIQTQIVDIDSDVDRLIAEQMHIDTVRMEAEDQLEALEEMVSTTFRNDQLQAAKAYSERVAKAYVRAVVQANYSALMAFEREMERAREEEEFLLLALMVF